MVLKTLSVTGGGGSGTVTSLTLDFAATGLLVNTTTAATITTAGTFSVSGVLGVPNGGTGASSMLAGLVSSNGTIYEPTTLNTGLSWAVGAASRVFLWGRQSLHAD